jgi:hypothetical protein
LHALHCIALHCTALHCIARIARIALHCTHCTATMQYSQKRAVLALFGARPGG